MMQIFCSITTLETAVTPYELIKAADAVINRAIDQAEHEYDIVAAYRLLDEVKILDRFIEHAIIRSRN